MDTLGPAHFGVILLLYRGGPLSEYCHDAVGTTQLLPFIERSNVVHHLFKGSFQKVHFIVWYQIRAKLNW